jgi:pimeloyl-ACP methyl ester carboxylesterase
MPTAKINGIDIYFERHGDDGEPLVLVHGYTGDITDWRHQLPEFSKTHRVLIMDLRGHGQSQAPSDRSRYTIDAMADDVEALAAEVGFERYHLLGHSRGGAVAQEIALRSPGRLLSLTLQDTTYRFGMSDIEIVRKYYEGRMRLAEEQGMEAVAAMPALVPPPPHTTAERQAETKARLARMSVDAFIGSWQTLHDWPGTEARAHRIAAPTMIIHGDLDAPFIEPAKWFVKTIPGAVVEVVPETAHSPQFERPALFNAALRRHLDRNAGAAAK